MVKLDLNVLYMMHLSLLVIESDHSYLYAVISVFLNALRNILSSPTPWFSEARLNPYLHNTKHTDEA